MSLLMLRRRDEAGEAARRALAIDDSDPVALHVLRMIAERRGSVSTD
jgi:hypothetical protein